MSPDDRVLVEAFSRRRDESSFRRLYRRHTPMIFAMAVRLCGSRAEAEELTQEAWVRAVERHDQFGWGSKYSTWLAGILVNCFRETVRRRKRIPHAFDETQSPTLAAVVSPFPGTHQTPADALDVERALARLPEGYREAVILHDVHGYTHQEIAAMLEIREGTSKSQLNRGRARLRELLTDTLRSGYDRDERGTS